MILDNFGLPYLRLATARTRRAIPDAAWQADTISGKARRGKPMQSLAIRLFDIEYEASFISSKTPQIFFSIKINGDPEYYPPYWYPNKEERSGDEIKALTEKVSDSFAEKMPRCLYEAVSLAFAAALAQHTGDEEWQQEIAKKAKQRANKMAKQLQGLRYKAGAPLGKKKSKVKCTKQVFYKELPDYIKRFIMSHDRTPKAGEAARHFKFANDKAMLRRRKAWEGDDFKQWNELMKEYEYSI